MKTFRVKLTYETVIRAESQADVESSANYVLKGSDEIPRQLEAVEITSLSELPDGWCGRCLAWETKPTYLDVPLKEILSPETITNETKA